MSDGIDRSLWGLREHAAEAEADLWAFLPEGARDSPEWKRTIRSSALMVAQFGGWEVMNAEREIRAQVPARRPGGRQAYNVESIAAQVRCAKRLGWTWGEIVQELERMGVVDE